ECMRAYILLELPGGRERVLNLYREIAAGRPKGYAAFYALTVLLLLRERERAIGGFREELAHPERWPGLQNREFYRHLLEYGAERISAEQLLKVAEPSWWNQNTAHYLIALSELSHGDRKEAGKHFQKCL